MKIQEELLLFANKGTHPIYINLPFFELSPMKIHALKSLNSSEMNYGIPEIVEDIIDILEILSMNHLPHEVKMSVTNCDITAHQYNQRTFIGASDSMLGFCFRHLNTMNINNYQLNPEWEDWIACQQMEPEFIAATYTSSEDDNGYANNYISLDDKEDRYGNNYISRAFLCGTVPVNQKDFTIRDTVNICLRPDYKSDDRGCFICPLCCLSVPAGHPQRDEFH